MNPVPGPHPPSPDGEAVAASAANPTPTDQVAHDLNNVLGGILGLVALVTRDATLSPVQQARLAELRQNAERGVMLVAALHASKSPRSESEPGAGTSFEILLQRANETAGPDSTPDPGSTPCPTVLLVEDDEILRSTYEELLVDQGTHVLGAADGVHALRKASRHHGRIDLLVSDIQMPRMGGIELWRKLARFRPEAQVLFISGDVEQARGLIGPGSDTPHLLGKPFTASALLRSVQALLPDTGSFWPEDAAPA